MNNAEIDNSVIETEIIKNECDEFRRAENTINLELDSARFFQILEKDFGYNYKTISTFIEGATYTFNEQQEFNIALRKLKRKYHIDIMDSILYLEDTILLSNILKFIDDETEWMLKEEIISKRGVKDTEHHIFENIS